MTRAKPNGNMASGSPARLIDHEGERLMVANILSRDGFFRRVGPQLTDDCFAVEQFRRVFVLARILHDSGRDPVLSEVFRLVLDSQKTPCEMGLPRLTDLAYENTVELADPDHWVRKLLVKANERRAWRLAERLRLGVESGQGAPTDFAAAREELKAIEGAFEPPAATKGTLGDAFAAIGMDKLLAAPRGTVATPWRRLNDLTNGGPRPGELWLLASRPSVGKSTAALQWALSAARRGQRVVFASLEMPQTDLLKRALSSEGNIPHGMLVRGDLDSSWRFRVAETHDQIGDYPLEIDDKLRTLQAIIGKLSATPGLGLLVIDYLGLVDPGGRFENRNQEVSVLSRRLKLAALDYGVPILALHQLNRVSETEKRPPQLSDLRDSGSLEQDADTVLLLDSPSQRKRSDDVDKNLVEVIIGKQRNGLRGHTIGLRLEGKFCRMSEIESQMEAPAWQG